jgi:hypothetical protein
MPKNLQHSCNPNSEESDTGVQIPLTELLESVQKMVRSMYATLKKGGGSKKGVALLLPNTIKAPKLQAVSC